MTRPRFLRCVDESTPEPVEIKRWWITGFNDAQVHRSTASTRRDVLDRLWRAATGLSPEFQPGGRAIRPRR